MSDINRLVREKVQRLPIMLKRITQDACGSDSLLEDGNEISRLPPPAASSRKTQLEVGQ